MTTMYETGESKRQVIPATREQDLRTFEEWFGVGDVGYRTAGLAMERKQKVDSELRGATGEVKYHSQVLDRYGDGKYWVYVTRTIDYNHPDRMARGL